MKDLSVSKLSAHAVRWAVPCVAVLSISACGGGDAPTASGSKADAAPAVATIPLKPPASAAAAAGVETITTAPSGVATSAANATLFVAGVLPGAQGESAGAARRKADTASPAQWLDAEPPVGTASAPVMVVVAGALPQEASTQGVTRSGATRLAR